MITASHMSSAPGVSGAGLHPTMPIPFDIMLQGRRYQGAGISLVSGKALGLQEPDMEGRREVALLQFTFDGFAVTLEADVELRLVETGEGNWIEFTFLDPAGPHLAQLRHILNAYIAGDLISLGAVLSPAAEAGNAPRPAQRGSATSRFLGGALRGGLTLAFTVSLVWLAVALIETRVLTVAEPHPAIVTMPGQVLRAPSAGQIDVLNPDANEGEVAFSILSNAGIVLNLRMPCDCDIAAVETFEGATVLAGEPVLRLADASSDPVITAQLGPEALAAVVRGYRMELTTPEGARIGAVLGPNAAQEITGTSGTGPVSVTLTPEAPLAEGTVGSLMRLSLVRPLPFDGIELRTLNDGLLSLFGVSQPDPVGLASVQPVQER